MALLKRHHRFVRLLAGVTAAVSLAYIAQRAQIRADLTSEGLSRLTEGTEELIRSVEPTRPVTVHAFVSAEVPRVFVPVRSRLLNVLHEMEAVGGDGLQVRIVEPEPHSAEAEEAIDKYGIMPRTLGTRESGRAGEQVFLGLAFVSGPREEVVPFMDRGLSVEYEVARALRVVTQERKKVVGILRTDAPLMGQFDIQNMRQQPAWRITDELEKQYEVRSLNPGAPIPDDVDVVLVPQLSSLTQEELDKLKTYVDAGRPALLTMDPMPVFDVRLAPSEPKLPPPGSGGMFGGGMRQPPEPKGDFHAFLEHVGVRWASDKIIYDTHNPHPGFAEAWPQIVFVTERPDGTEPFVDADPIVDGLTEVVVLFGGVLKAVSGHEDEFTPLLVTGKTAGFNVFDDMVSRHMLFGVQGPVPPRKRSPITGENHVMAARVKSAGSSDEEGESKGRNLILIADLDIFGDQFFAMHERGGDLDGDGLVDLRFDNVTFLLNCVDSLAGDDRFVALRKRKAEYRRLTQVDDLTREARAERERRIQEANSQAESQLQEAQAALDEAVEAIRKKEGLDETTKQVMVRSAEAAENRRLQAKQEKIDLDKTRAMAKIEAEHVRKIDEVRNQIRLTAVLLPPIPALLLGAFIFARKRRREHETIPEGRKRGAPGASKKGGKKA